MVIMPQLEQAQNIVGPASSSLTGKTAPEAAGIDQLLAYDQRTCKRRGAEGDNQKRDYHHSSAGHHDDQTLQVAGEGE